MPAKSMTDLFDQLGLPSDEASIQLFLANTTAFAANVVWCKRRFGMRASACFCRKPWRKILNGR
jgi:hypothetical protein